MPSSRPEETIIFPMVVDSPPGTMIPASPSRSSTARTSTGSTPSPRRISACSLKSPCSASTPTFFGPSCMRATPFVSPLPATGREPLSFCQVAHFSTYHRHSKTPARLSHGLRVLEMGRSLHDGPSSEGRIPTLEDAAPDEHTVGPQLHHQGRVRRGGYTSGCEQHDRQPPVLGDPPHELVWSPEVLCLRHHLLVIEGADPANAADYGAHVPHGLDYVACACLALGTDHGRPLADAPQRLSEVRSATHEWHVEDGLVYVMLLVSGGQDLGLIYVVDFESLQDLGLHEVSDARLRHHGDGDGLLDLDDLLGVAHPSDPAIGPNISGYALQGHDGHRSRLLGDPGLLGVDDVHDDPALEHLGHPALDPEGPCQLSIIGHVILPSVSTRICKGYLTTVAPARQTILGFRLQLVRTGPPQRFLRSLVYSSENFLMNACTAWLAARLAAGKATVASRRVISSTLRNIRALVVLSGTEAPSVLVLFVTLSLCAPGVRGPKIRGA